MKSKLPELEVITTRVFNTARERVFEAFTDPKQLAKWWGPKGFTNTFQTFEFKPGGKWIFVMHGPDGKDFNNESTFLEIVPLEKIVYEHKQPWYHMTITLAERAGKTAMTWRMLFDAKPDNAKLKAFLSQATEENFDRLEALLA